MRRKWMNVIRIWNESNGSVYHITVDVLITESDLMFTMFVRHEVPYKLGSGG